MDVETVSEIDFDHPRLPNGKLEILHRTRYAVGVDVGQAHDPTAICIAAHTVSTPLLVRFAKHNPFPRPRVDVLHLERLPLGKPYPQQVDHIAALLLRDPLVRWKPRVLVDYTGVGRPVFDMFVERPALRFAEGVVITAGRETKEIPAGWSAPKVELVSKLQALLHEAAKDSARHARGRRAHARVAGFSCSLHRRRECDVRGA